YTMCIIALSCSAADVPAEYKQAIEPRTFHFPADHGSHAGYQTEWWYVTGNVAAADGRKFGYQFTIFRRSVDAQTPQQRGRTSAWAASDVFMGHAAISDIASKQFYFLDDMARGSLDIAGATSVDDDPAVAAGVTVSMKKWKFNRTANGWTVTVPGDSF